MIHEYALEPELVATWVDRRVGRYFVEKFGLGQPRIVSRYPKRWKKLVWEAFRSDSDIERTRMAELLMRLCEAMVKRRDGVWAPERAWLENAQMEHARLPFHAILARQNPSGHPRVLIADELDDRTTHWDVQRGVTVARSANDMAAAVSAMLRTAEVVIFVDPYFGPERVRHRRPLEAFLRSALQARPLTGLLRVEIHTAWSDEVSREFFEDGCRQRLPRCVPGGMRLVVVRLRRKDGGERPHNRYILTDIGGVIFNAGLDDGEEGERDDVTLMDRSQYELRWSQHTAANAVFDEPEGRLEVEGRG